MVLKRDVPCQSSHKIQLYSPKYREQYLALHSDDGYWTAEKVIDASDRFRIILALEEDTVVGYMDITHKFEENEPFDLFVKEEYRRRGYGRAILAKAIELNRPKAMMLLVDTDNTAAISLYESLGFDRFVGGNNITAHVSL
ncbi:GNAT family N-acetyltransferase [Acetatifactor aquisgranensis]|uniref:GNAT family N-acetyltransferase n=1 Tax=Acetatifactor aquisgranensis TaxID=2941233 RepID=UPI00203CD705|nr:GNAT family N-acetyltransferase [Acetatifactor aquisgranensis]